MVLHAERSLCARPVKARVMHKEEAVPILETERMLIRPLSLNDLPLLTVILSDTEVMKHSESERGRTKLTH